MRHPISFFLMKTTGILPECIFFKRKTYYEDRTIQKKKIKGGALLVSNHKSILDYMMYFFLFFFRKIHCLVAEVMYRNPFFRFCINTIGGIKVDRKNPNISGFVNHAVDLLKKGKLLLAFPEGRLIHEDKLGEFHPSYILIALKAGVPIIPLYTDGRYGFFRRSRCIIGKPIDLRNHCRSEQPNREEIEQLNSLVKGKIEELKETLDRRKRNKLFSPKKFFMDLGRIHVYAVFGLFFRLKIHLSPSSPKSNKIQGHAIVVANHNSFLDPLILICAFWRRRCRLLMAKVVVDGHRFRGFLLKHLGCIKIDRHSLDIESIRQCNAALASDQMLIIFPEGKINRDEIAGEFKSGAAMLAIKSKAPILPCYVKKGKHWYNRSHVYMGETIETRAISKGGLKAIDDLTSTIKNSIMSLEYLAEKGE